MRPHSTALLCSLFLVSPLFGAPPTPEHEKQMLLRAAGSSLVMQPGDRDAFAGALDNPILFVETPQQQEFNGSMLVRAKPDRAQTAKSRIQPLLRQQSIYVEEYVLDIPAGMDEGEFATMLMATGDYIYAEPNWTLYPASTFPNDPQFGSSWQHSRIESAAAWDLNTGSSSVIIAICDTGVDLDHPDLEDALVSGYNSWTNVAQADGGNVSPSSGHGTFVSGCAAAIGNNNRGVVGVGWNHSIMPIRITANNGTTASSQIADGARWAAENGARIINVSFTGATSAASGELSRDLKAMGSLLFYAAGNDNATISFDRPDMVIVAATTSSDNRWNSSNHGTAVSVAAPGSNVRSTQNGGSYGNGSGTSYASPIAAGVGAMIFSVNPNFGPDDVQEILYNSVDDLGSPGRDTSFGHGRVNTFNAIVDAQNYTPRVLLPITESFESASWMGLLQPTNGSVSAIADPDAPDGAQALMMDASDSVETALLAGRAAALNDHTLSMKIKAQGVEPGESLEIQFRDADNNWNTLIEMPSFGIDTNGFVQIETPLDDPFGYHGVSLRILAHGNDASDQWLIDDLRIEPTTPMQLPFTDSFDSGVLSVFKWDPASTSATPGASAGAIALEIDNELHAETVDINLASLIVEGGFVNFFASTQNPGSDDTLTIEVRDFVGNWTPLDTIDASALSANPKGYSYEIPFLAMSENFRLRLSDSPNAGGFFIDNLEIGDQPLALGCNGADFAEPMGTLDIFDVFAFLDAYNAQDPSADFAEPMGILDIFDVFAFLDLYNAGCP